MFIVIFVSMRLVLRLETQYEIRNEYGESQKTTMITVIFA